MRPTIEFETHAKGYTVIRHNHGGGFEKVQLHRLIAVAKYGFDAVKDMDIHHSSGVEWDNRMSNIEIMPKANHAKIHADSFEDKPTPYRDEDLMVRLYVDEGLSGEKIADRLGCSNGTAYNWLREFGLV